MSQNTAPKCISLFMLQPAELIIRDRPGSTSIKSSGCVHVQRGWEGKWNGGEWESMKALFKAHGIEVVM